jgi:biotin synthase
LIAQLASLDPPPESVPINLLVRIPGTPLSDIPALDPIEFVRTVAVARICLPTSMVRLSAGRQEMPEYLQALCFFAGANSIFYGDKLLTTPNPDTDKDRALFAKLGLHAMPVAVDAAPAESAVAKRCC